MFLARRRVMHENAACAYMKHGFCLVRFQQQFTYHAPVWVVAQPGVEGACALCYCVSSFLQDFLSCLKMWPAPGESHENRMDCVVSLVCPFHHEVRRHASFELRAPSFGVSSKAPLYPQNHTYHIKLKADYLHAFIWGRPCQSYALLLHENRLNPMFFYG